MRSLTIELKKCKRTGILEVLPIIGLLGALYAFANFIVRKDVLLNLPLPPMDVLLTQLYGMIMILNMFGIIVATTLTYNIELKRCICFLSRHHLFSKINFIYCLFCLLFVSSCRTELCVLLEIYFCLVELLNY